MPLRLVPAQVSSGPGPVPRRPHAPYDSSMLPTHNRYGYTRIADRPVYDWPNGKRLAFYVCTGSVALSTGW
jgi:hypothetical protein